LCLYIYTNTNCFKIFLVSMSFFNGNISNFFSICFTFFIKYRIFFDFSSCIFIIPEFFSSVTTIPEEFLIFFRYCSDASKKLWYYINFNIFHYIPLIPLHLIPIVVNQVVKHKKISTLYFYKMLTSIWLRG